VNGLPQMIDAKHLPIVLPEVEKYLPTEDGQPPLGNALVWAWDSINNKVVNTNLVDNKTIYPLELNTMPGWAGSSWYWMRYMDAHNEGHLLYSRFWNKFLKDKGFAPTEEPFKKLINQGMILGMSAFVYRLLIITIKKHQIITTLPVEFPTYFVSSSLYKSEKFKDVFAGIIGKNFHLIIQFLKNEQILNDSQINALSIADVGFMDSNLHTDVNFVNASDELDIEKFKNWRKEFRKAFFIGEKGEIINGSNDKFIVGREIEKMSKSKYNVVTPDDICNEYGADTLRLYEMFLGPLEQAKPWNTAGISGVFGFLKKLWRLYFDENGLIVNNDEPTKDNLKSLHKTIKKVAEDIEGFSFNTSVSQFMICVNELSTQNCHSRAILEPLTVLISSYAPHIAEELWSQLGNSGSISTVDFPTLDEKHLVESSKEYPVSFNGKMRFTIELSLDLSKEQIEEIIMQDERTLKQLDGKIPNKIIIVPGKVINLVG
jgi:leucyl-tRNA synthetase